MGFSDTFSALSDPTRREILVLLRKGSLSAGEIGTHFNITGAAVSYHLNKLKEADLIRERKVKNFIFYELNATIFDEVLLWIEQFKGGNSDER